MSGALASQLPSPVAADPPPPPGFTVDAPAPAADPPPPQGFTLDAPAPVPVSAPATDPAPPPGFTLDVGQSLTAAPVPLMERIGANVREGFQHSLLGSAANYLATKLAPDSNPIDPNTGQPMGGMTPREQVIAGEREREARFQQMPSYKDERGSTLTPSMEDAGTVDFPAAGFPRSAVAGAGALAGSIAGSAASPESLVGGPAGYSAVRAGAPLARTMIEQGGKQAVIQGVANTGAQGLNIAAGTQDNFEPAQVAQAAGTGLILGALPAAVGTAVNTAVGAKPPVNVIDMRTGQPSTRPDDLPRSSILDRWPQQAEPQGAIKGPEAPIVDAPQGVAGPEAPPAPPALAAPQKAIAGPEATPPAVTPDPAPPPGFVVDATPPVVKPAPAPTPAATAPADTATTTPADTPPAPAPAPAGADTAPVPVPAPTPPAPVPATAPDTTGTVTTPSGNKLAVNYEVVPAASLTAASGDLQPRDRAGRLASDAQINSIAANLDPSRLMRSTESDRGAPIVGPDNIVESGNGRVAAIKQAAEQHPAKYAAYVQALNDAGHNTAGIDTPVLVARRTTPLTDAQRQASVIDHNQSATQVMSAPEQAQVDGRSLTSDLLAKYDTTQDPTAAANRDFVRSWTATLPESERNGVGDAEGNLSADGLRRLNGAMLARAYGDKGVLARGLESTDDNTKSISGGLADAAPAWAVLRAGVEDGKIPAQFDVSKQLVEAADIVRQARERKQTMADILGQQDAFKPRTDPVVEQFVRALYNADTLGAGGRPVPAGTRPASRVAIGSVLKKYAAAVGRETENGSAPSLFGDEHAKLTPVQILKSVVDRRDADATGDTGTQGSLLGGPGTGLKTPAPTPAPQPAPSPQPTKSRFGLRPGGRDMTGSVPAHTPDTAAQTAADWVLQHGGATGHEHAAVVDHTTGQIVHASTDGLPSSVGFKTPSDTAPGSLTLHHNHPDNRALSGPDIRALGSQWLRHVVAHGHGGSVYSASLAPGKSAATIGRNYGPAERDVVALMQGLVNAREIDAKTADAHGHDLINRLLAAQGVINYKSTLAIPSTIRPAFDKLLQDKGVAPDAVARHTAAVRAGDIIAGLPGRVAGLSRAGSAGSGNHSAPLLDSARAGTADAGPVSLNLDDDANAPDFSGTGEDDDSQPLKSDRPPLGGDRPDGTFAKGTSKYRQAFRDAGEDPDLMVSRPLVEQNRVLAKHVQDTFGFKAVDIGKNQHPKETRDFLSDFYQNARAMSDALGMPYTGISLDGRLSLTTKPYVSVKQALGTYFPKTREISIAGRANSFAHEWTHGLDHYLSDVLAKNPAAMKMLSRTKGITEGTIGGKKFGPDSPAAAFVGVMKAIYGKDAADAVEALKLQYELRTTKDPNRVIAATQRLDAIQTDFVKGARSVPGKYWSDPAELLARAHEAYVANQIHLNGGDTAGVAKPYHHEDAGDQFAKYYPQEGERAHIFQAFTDLHDALRRDSILDPNGTGPGAKPDGLDMVDPSRWHRMADPKRDPGLWAMLRREVQAQKNLRAQIWARLGYSPTAADPGPRLGVLTRAADVGRALTYSTGGIAEALTARQPKGLARDAFQQITDLILPAHGIRSTAEAAGRYVGPVFEQRVREASRANLNKMTNILDQHGLGSMTDMEKAMLRHTMTEGRGDNFVPTGEKKAVAIPDNISKAGAQLRYLLDEEWERNTKAKIDVGYARNGYFPRQYDDHKIFGDRKGFVAQADKLHRLMFEQEVGDEPEKLLAAYDRLPKDVQDGLDPDMRDLMDELRANLKAQDKLMSEDKDGDELDNLRERAAELHDELHDPVRDLYANYAANEWFSRINEGDPTDFDTRGPNGAYKRKRVLPPEADTIMRDYMVNDPTEALPRYFQQSARKVAFADTFGPNGSKLDNLLHEASEGGARGEDIRTMRGLVESVTGRQKSGLPTGVERFANTIHALGSMALMPRAAWSSLTEPMAVLARTESFKATVMSFAHQLGDIIRTAGSQQRAEMANALGITVSHLHDSVIADRTDAHYRDAPGLSKLLTNFYRRTGLTALTNSQRRSVMASGHIALTAWSKDFLGDNARTKRDAAAQFRDIGVPDAQHENLAKWILAKPGLPTIKDLDSKGGRLWGHAISFLVDQVIQDPMRVDKPLMSQNPLGRLAYGLMSFNYSFYKKIIEQPLDRHFSRIKEAYEDARHAGSGRIVSGVKAAPAAGRATLAISAAAAAIFLGSLATTILRENLFNPDKLKEREAEGDLWDYYMDLAVQRTGVNGPLDPIAQAVSGLKYERDLSSLMAGAQTGFFLQNAGDMLKPFAGFGSPDTNTSEYNAIRGAWNMFGLPAASIALTVLPGGPLASAGYGTAMQFLTSRRAADAVATTLVGPKGTGPGGEPPPEKEPPEPGAPPKGTGSGLLGGVPIGALDDVAAPAGKVAMPLLQRLPKAGKIGLGVAAGAAAADGLATAFGRWKAD